MSAKKVHVEVKREDEEPVAESEELTPVPEETVVEDAGEGAAEEAAPQPEIDWQDKALRLQAEMDNFRKRQRRLADDRVAQDKRMLLQGFLRVMDNLEKVVEHLDPDDPHHQGIQVTYNEMRKVLRQAGAEPLETIGQPFDPSWHEAVAMVPAPADQEEDLLVIDEEQRGYRLGDRVLRPARVIVAKKADAA